MNDFHSSPQSHRFKDGSNRTQLSSSPGQSAPLESAGDVRSRSSSSVDSPVGSPSNVNASSNSFEVLEMSLPDMVGVLHPTGSPAAIIEITQLLEANNIVPPGGEELAIVEAVLGNAHGCDLLLNVGARVMSNPHEYFLNLSGDPLKPPTLMAALRGMTSSAKAGIGCKARKPTVAVMGAFIMDLVGSTDYSAARLRAAVGAPSTFLCRQLEVALCFLTELVITVVVFRETTSLSANRENANARVIEELKEMVVSLQGEVRALKSTSRDREQREFAVPQQTPSAAAPMSSARVRGRGLSGTTLPLSSSPFPQPVPGVPDEPWDESSESSESSSDKWDIETSNDAANAPSLKVAAQSVAEGEAVEMANMLVGYSNHLGGGVKGTTMAVRFPPDLERSVAQAIQANCHPWIQLSKAGVKGYYFIGQGLKKSFELEPNRYQKSSKMISATDSFKMINPPCRVEGIPEFAQDSIMAGHYTETILLVHRFVQTKAAYVLGGRRGGIVSLPARVEARIVMLFNLMLLAFMHHDLVPSEENAAIIFNNMFPASVRALTDSWFAVKNVSHAFWILLWVCKEHKSLCFPCHKCTTLVMPGDSNLYLTVAGYAAYNAAKKAISPSMFMTMVEFAAVKGNEHYKVQRKSPALRKPVSQDSHLAMFLGGGGFGEDFCLPV